MGNVHSVPNHNLYIIKVSNKDLPLVPFIHTIVGYNNIPIKDTDPLVLSEILRSQDLILDIFDILQNKKFKIMVPKFSDPETGKLGINVTKLPSIPSIFNIRVTAVSESANTNLNIGDNILGIEGLFLENENELIYEIKTNTICKLVVLREDKAVLIEISGNRLNCEIGTGLIHKPISKEYFMEGYSRKIQKVIEETAIPQNDAQKVTDKNNNMNEETNTNEINNSIEEINTNEINNMTEEVRNPIEEINTNDNFDSNVQSTPLPQIPNKTRAVFNKDRTGSYTYKSPNTVPQLIPSHEESFGEYNQRMIYEEANLPQEKEFFQGQKHGDLETATVLNTDLVCEDDFIVKDGKKLMKDSVFEERKINNEKISNIFEDDDDTLPFETKREDKNQSL